MIFEIISIIIVALGSSFTTRWLLTRKAVYGYFYMQMDNPEDPEDVTIRVSIPSNQYYLDKKRIILERGDWNESILAKYKWESKSQK